MGSGWNGGSGVPHDDHDDGAGRDGELTSRRAGTLERGLAILELLTASRRVSAGRISEELGLSRSATYRILGVLRQRGYVEWDDGSEHISLAGQAVLTGMAALESFDPFQVAQALLRGLSRELAEAALMAVRDGDRMVYIAHEDVTDHSIAVRRLLGVRRHLHSTSLGKAFLAALPVKECDELVDRLELARMTTATITDPDALRAELARTRARGFSIDAAENEPDVLCFGAAIRDDSGRPVCAISVAGPLERMRGKRDVIPARVVAAASEVSRRLGYLGTTSRGTDLQTSTGRPGSRNVNDGDVRRQQ
jgi:DNA-binding IclR family transcriptional regulator